MWVTKTVRVKFMRMDYIRELREELIFQRPTSKNIYLYSLPYVSRAKAKPKAKRVYINDFILLRLSKMCIILYCGCTPMFRNLIRSPSRSRIRYGTIDRSILSLRKDSKEDGASLERVGFRGRARI